MRRVIGLSLCLLLLLSCRSSEEMLQVGAKPFAEQAILAEMIRLLAREAGQTAEVTPCADSYACHRRLREGRLDVMVEYSGTALQFVGGPPPEPEDAIGQVRALFRPLGLGWLEPLGFDNGYRILVPQNQGLTRDVDAIDDLSRLSGGVRVASPAEFLRRSRDGLPALLRRYGLELSSEPLIIEDPTTRFQAVRDGRADVAVGYSTDGSITALGLRALADPLEFFPPYEAAIVLREKSFAGQGRAALRRRLEALSAKLPDETMRRLNYAVQLEGQPAEGVARSFLEEQHLLDSQGRQRGGIAPLLVATAAGDGLTPETARALRALRQLFPSRPVRRHSSDREAPFVALERGRAQFAVVGAERFFPRGGESPRAEAVAVLGDRIVHVIRRSPSESEPLEGRIGLQPEGTLGARIGEALLALAGGEASTRGEAGDLLEGLGAGELDGALIIAESGDAELGRALEDEALRPTSLGPWLSPSRAVQLPYLQRVRLPLGTYPHQVDVIDTLSVQIVLAAPTQRSSGTGQAGPAAALPPTSRPLTPAQLERLIEATGILELPDAVLPSAWTSANHRGHRSGESEGFDQLLETALNLFVILFLVWIALLVLRRGASEAMTEGEEPDR